MCYYGDLLLWKLPLPSPAPSLISPRLKGDIYFTQEEPQAKKKKKFPPALLSGL